LKIDLRHFVPLSSTMLWVCRLWQWEHQLHNGLCDLSIIKEHSTYPISEVMQ
jgi:hypothetical protein